MQTGFYFKTLILPTAYPDLFADFLLDFTQEAIEEDCVSNLGDHPYQYTGGGRQTHVLPHIAYIVYSNQEPSALLQSLEGFCQTLGDQDLPVGFYHHTSTHPNLDWINAYQQSIQPITCGQFYITPSWIPPTDTPLRVLTLDPSLAFGTGHHESTRMLLEGFSSMPAKTFKGKLALDVGCGSGILGLALASLGACVHLCDIDPLAIEQAQKNFARNHLNIGRIWQGSLEQQAVSYDLIAINIVADVILGLYPFVLQASHADTLLFLSGILDQHAHAVLECYTQGFELLEQKIENEWVGLSLRAKPS
ncbi:Ribosomal protein L11 methyltransferase PrmA [Helicobacter bizzozeronii]|uniref:50S ribosomal protein L11 methyltransferase n=1 Tax=Helicobacter bizzozeronii TaxID=56877 RepID=UPI00244D899F|nr:50S ribosomal protein L11 methyltransferase [Helicobacter bizzozeronii]GMB92933.1 Ribosomal protein L11 methyltransferase PrmA [Helicobacter bizzozeronii]